MLKVKVSTKLELSTREVNESTARIEWPVRAVTWLQVQESLTGVSLQIVLTITLEHTQTPKTKQY